MAHMRKSGGKRRGNTNRRGRSGDRGRHALKNVKGAIPDIFVKPGRPLPQNRDVKKLLEGIGTPPATPFKPDQFQLEALAALEYEDVLVTAPTGSGKTWIAREEIRRLLESS